MGNESPLVSVMIPVYNAEKYLRPCLDSVLRQSEGRFEVLCCNDGSTDGSLKILKEYVGRDARVKVFTQKNSGSSVARNACLDRAVGKYLYFVDNDDMIDKDALRDLCAAAESDKLDVVYTNPTWIAESPEMKDPYANVKDPVPAALSVTTGAKIFVAAVANTNYYAAPWRRFIRRAFAESIGLRFNPEASPNEDNLFSFLVDVNAKRARFVKKRCYIHRSHSGSTMIQMAKNVSLGRNVVSHAICAFEIMAYARTLKLDRDVQDAIKKRVVTLMNGALRFFDNSGLKVEELDWRGHWIEQNLFRFMSSLRPKSGGAAPAVKAAADVVRPLPMPRPPEGASWLGRVKWALKHRLRRCLGLDILLARSSAAASVVQGGNVAALVDDRFYKLMKEIRLAGRDDPDATWRDAIIEKIEIFFYKVDVERNFSHGSWKWRYQCMIRVSSGDMCGWSELTVPKPENIHRILTEASCRFQGTTVGGGFSLCKLLRGVVADSILESMEMALIDLSARLKGCDALTFLGLASASKMPYLECVLQRDPAKAAELAKLLARKYLKLKLFGDLKLDAEIVKSVRAVIPADCYLTADVNSGYLATDAERRLPLSAKIDALKRVLTELKAVGLNACEDPAPLSLADMCEAQKAIDIMPIIPDAPLRPAYRVSHSLKPVPGHIYNLHPHCMGSVYATIRLAEVIRQGGGRIMIGDNSLIGVGCTQWQMLAGGLGADWCEAVEKSLEGSDRFAQCVIRKAMSKDDDGYCRYAGKGVLGFGVDIDTEKLKSICRGYVEVSTSTES